MPVDRDLIRPSTRRRGRLMAVAALALAAGISVSPVLPGPWQAPIAHAQTAPPPTSFAPLAQRLSPAVVNISTTKVIEGQRRGAPQMPQFPPGSPFERFFKDFFGRNGVPDLDRPSGRVRALGSGFVIDASGYIVTNNHVIDGADEIKVILHDQSELDAKLIGRDPRTDLALLKVEAGKPLPFVGFGDSDKALVGDWVLAIGNPFGLGGTVRASSRPAPATSMPGPMTTSSRPTPPSTRATRAGRSSTSMARWSGSTPPSFRPRAAASVWDSRFPPTSPNR